MRRSAVALGLFFLLGWPMGAHGDELSQKFLDIYSQGAFATTSQLVKFRRVPTLSVFCADDACRPTVESLKAVLAKVVPVQQAPSENTGANIEILFYPDEEHRRLSKNEHKVQPGVDVGKSAHEGCSMVQFRRGFEIDKVIVVATEDAGSRANLICILSETLRGSGVTVRGSYPDYIGEYLALDEAKFSQTLKGLELILALHFSLATKPGQDNATVRQALNQSFTIPY